MSKALHRKKKEEPNDMLCKAKDSHTKRRGEIKGRTYPEDRPSCRTCGLLDQ